MSSARPSSKPLSAALQLLRETDERIAALGVRRLSLSDQRSQASALATIGQQLLDPESDGALALPLASMLGSLVEAQLAHFPDNLFWDLDFLASSVLDRARAEGPAGPGMIQEHSGIVLDLYRRFGTQSPIRFRYVHDFTYGFDWAKWVKKSPSERASVGPFDLRFLRAMQQRGDELLELIDADDSDYPSLPQEQVRNPFGFKRDPQSEHDLLRALARAECIPVPTWQMAAAPDWTRPFAQIRCNQARLMGLSAVR